MVFPKTRLRRLRGKESLRNLVSAPPLVSTKFILPLFVKHGTGIRAPIPSMPGHYQLSVDKLAEEIRSLVKIGIKSVILFGIPEHKDPSGSIAFHSENVVQQAIELIKRIAPELLVISDVCLCEYTDHGHCGIVTSPLHAPEVEIHNDQTLALLAKQAVSHAQAGCDVVAPSANMDGMVHYIREALDAANFFHIPILSYSVKYASSFYGPFRQAAEGAPKFGDRRSYQMNFTHNQEAVYECNLDIAEGADLLMVKPAHTYLDIIHLIKKTFPALPLGAYHTSGEFAMLKAAAEKGWIDEKNSVLEVLTAMQRAGADFIITYYAKEVMAWLN